MRNRLTAGTCYRSRIFSQSDHQWEAAQHHATHIASMIRKAIESAGDVEIDGIAFSQGPGTGPCLRTVATAARALTLSLDVPLMGVNHCVAPRDRQVAVWNRQSFICTEKLINI